MKYVDCFVITIMSALSLPSSLAFELKSGIVISPNHRKISYVECAGKSEGSPATLFIHGLDSSCKCVILVVRISFYSKYLTLVALYIVAHTWRGVQESLATQSRSIAMDCRGCGRSDLGEAKDFSPDALVEDVKCLVTSHSFLRDKPFVLVGGLMFMLSSVNQHALYY